MPYNIKLLPLYFSFMGSFFIIFNNYLLKKYNYLKISLIFKQLYIFLIKSWYFDIIYNRFFVLSVLSLGFFSFKNIDRGLIELLGPLGLVRIFSLFINKAKVLQSGFVYHYVFLIVIGVTCFLTFILILNFLFIYNIDPRFYIICIFIIFFIISKLI